MDSTDELIARLEAADEGSRELDAAVRFEIVGDMTRCNFDEGCYHGECESPGCGGWLGIVDERHSYPRNWQDDERLPHYTTSLDAALTLVPEGRGWYLFSADPTNDWKCEAAVAVDADPAKEANCSFAATPALSLCIAALKARQTTPVSPEDACERLPVGPTMAESKKAMDALTDFLVEDLMSMSDEEILAEVIEDGGDPDEIVRQVRANVEKLITRRRS